MRKLNALAVVAALALGNIFCPGLSFPVDSRTLEPAAGLQGQDFITVDGPDLKSRMQSAVERDRSAGRKSPFWTAFTTDLRSGVRVDAGAHDLEVLLDAPSDEEIARPAPAAAAPAGAQQLAIFLLHEPGGGAVTRVEVYDLNGRRDYEGYPVYWLGRVQSEESLGFFQGLVETNKSQRVATRSLMAIALHDSPRVQPILKGYVQQSADKRLRGTAILWLGQVGGEQSFLADLVRDERESAEARKQAALALGIGRDKASFAAIRSLYDAVSQPEVKKHLILAASLNENKDEAVNFLTGTAKGDADFGSRKQAVLWLGLRAGQRGLEALGEIINSPDADTELQRHAVLALSLSGSKEAIPMLNAITQTHPKPEVRKQAVFWLNRTQGGSARKIR